MYHAHREFALLGQFCPLGPHIFSKRRHGLSKIDCNHAAEDIASLPVEMSLVGYGPAVGVLLCDSERLACRRADLVEIGDALGLKIYQRHTHGSCYSLHCVGVREQIAMDLALRAEVTARKWSDEDGTNARGPRFADELAEILLVLGHRRLSRKVVGRLHVVVTELDQHVIRFGGQAPGPESICAEGLRAGSAMGHIEAVDESCEVRTKTPAITSVICLRGIANQFNPYRRTSFENSARRGTSENPGVLSIMKAQNDQDKCSREASCAEPEEHDAAIVTSCLRKCEVGP